MNEDPRAMVFKSDANGISWTNPWLMKAAGEAWSKAVAAELMRISPLLRSLKEDYRGK